MVETRSAKRRCLGSSDLDSAYDRLQAMGFTSHSPVSNKLAAVLVALFQDSDGLVRVVLTRRSTSVSTHKGEVCLPGGKRDDLDETDERTALREAQEELGLDPAIVKVLCKFPPLLSKHYLSVTPVVARIPAQVSFTPNKDEVSDVFSPPLHMFLEDRNHHHKDVTWHGFQYRCHYFKYEEYIIWGLTAEVVIRVAAAAFAREPNFDDKGPGSRPFSQLCYRDNQLCVTSGLANSLPRHSPVWSNLSK